MEAECSKQCGGGYTTLTRRVISGHNCDARQDTVRIDGYIIAKNIYNQSPGEDGAL